MCVCAGIVIIPSAILGVLCGGLLARRFSTDAIHNTRLLVWLIIVSMLGLASLMFVSCQRVLVPGFNTDYDAALAPRSALRTYRPHLRLRVHQPIQPISVCTTPAPFVHSYTLHSTLYRRTFLRELAKERNNWKKT